MVCSEYSSLGLGSYLVQCLWVAETGRLGCGAVREACGVPRLYTVRQVVLGHIGSWQAEGKVPNLHVAKGQAVLGLVCKVLRAGGLTVSLASGILGCISCLCMCAIILTWLTCIATLQINAAHQLMSAAGPQQSSPSQTQTQRETADRQHRHDRGTHRGRDQQGYRYMHTRTNC